MADLVALPPPMAATMPWHFKWRATTVEGHFFTDGQRVHGAICRSALLVFFFRVLGCSSDLAGSLVRGTRCGTDRGSPQRRCSWRRSRGGRCCRGSASRRHLPATSAPLQEQLDEPRHDVLGANGDAHCLPWPAGSCGASMRVTA